MPNSNWNLPLFPWITVLSLSEISVCIKQFDRQNIENPLLKLPERYHPPVQKESSADALRRLNFSHCKPQSRVINDPAKPELLCECIICHQLLGSKLLQHTHFSLYLQNRLGVFFVELLVLSSSVFSCPFPLAEAATCQTRDCDLAQCQKQQVLSSRECCVCDWLCTVFLTLLHLWDADATASQDV